MVAVSFAWILYVDSVPAAKRPWVGSTKNNTELGLTFEYNGLGRVEGQVGGPGGPCAKPAPTCRRRSPERCRPRPATAGGHPAAVAAASTPRTAARPRRRSWPRVGKRPDPFGESPGPLRLFRFGLGDQAGWILPFALLGALALALLLLERCCKAPGIAEELSRGCATRAWRCCSCSAAGSWSRRWS